MRGERGDRIMFLFLSFLFNKYLQPTKHFTLKMLFDGCKGRTGGGNWERVGLVLFRSTYGELLVHQTN